MKKILFMMLLFVFCVLMQCVAYCDETSVNIGYARQTDSSTITVTGSVLNPVENQTFIVMMSTSENGVYNTDEILYFNQITPVIGDNGLFTIKLKTGHQVDANTEYLIRIGGENITAIEEKLLGYELSYGDVDGDYIITANDAAMVFKYVLDKSQNPLDDTQKKKAAVSGLKQLSAADTACILNKSQNYSYKFPVE
jgi:hypothetical protein